MFAYNLQRAQSKSVTAQISEGIHGVKYTTWNTRCILWCIPVFGVFLPLFGVFRPGIHQTPPFGVFRMVYSQSNSTYTRHFRPKMMPQCTHLIWRLLQMPQGGHTGSGCWGSSAPAAPAAAAVPMWRASRQWLPGTDEAPPSPTRGALGYFQWCISLPLGDLTCAAGFGVFPMGYFVALPGQEIAHLQHTAPLPY